MVLDQNRWTGTCIADTLLGYLTAAPREMKRKSWSASLGSRAEISNRHFSPQAVCRFRAECQPPHKSGVPTFTNPFKSLGEFLTSGLEWFGDLWIVLAATGPIGVRAAIRMARAIGALLGSMKVTEQSDAMEASGLYSHAAALDDCVGRISASVSRFSDSLLLDADGGGVAGLAADRNSQRVISGRQARRDGDVGLHHAEEVRGESEKRHLRLS
jgi:hypothetical protein